MVSFNNTQDLFIFNCGSRIPVATAFEPEDLINEVAGILLATTGRPDLSPELLKHYQRGRNSLSAYCHRYRNDHEKLFQAIQNYDINLRVPLLGIREMAQQEQIGETSTWRLPAEIFSYLKTSPNAVVLTDQSLQKIQSKLMTIDWRTVGTIIERHLRSFFGIHSKTPISVAIYGKTVWGDERSNDTDLLLVIDDLECYIAETGGSRPNIVCPGLANSFPYDIRPLTNELDVAIYGLGALSNGTLNHDTINSILWARLNGIQVAGESTINFFSDWMVCQNVLVTLGYAMKNALVNFETKSKKLTHFVRMEFAHCIYIGKKYLPELDPTINEWQHRYSSFNDDPNLEDFLQNAVFVAGVSKKLLLHIKQKTIENAAFILSNLIGNEANITIMS